MPPLYKARLRTPGEGRTSHNERTAEGQPSGRPDSRTRPRLRPDADRPAGPQRHHGAGPEDDRRSRGAAAFAGPDRAERPGRQARRPEAGARRRPAERHPVHQPSGAQRRPHGDARHGRDLADRKLRQGSAERDGVGVLQGWLQRHRRRGRAQRGQARRRAADLRRHGPRGQPRQVRRTGLGLHRHVMVGRRLQRLHLLRPEPDDRRRSRPTSAIRTAPAPSPAGPTPRPPAPTFRPATRRAAAAAPARRRRRTSIRATSSASTRRPAASLPSCPATEAIHELRSTSWPPWRRPRPFSACRRRPARKRLPRRRPARPRQRPRRPRPSAARSSRRSCRR